MRISELAAQTQVPVATLKYYLREGLLPSGTATSRTQATYNAAHVDRVRLIRALLESGGLSLTRVRQVLDTLDSPNVPRHELLGVAQESITPPLPQQPDPEWTALATEFAASRNWPTRADDPLLVLLGEQLRLIVAAGVLGADLTQLDRYADAAERLAAVDMSTVPDDADGALRQVTVGTVLTDPMILTLRRLAQQTLSTTNGE